MEITLLSLGARGPNPPTWLSYPLFLNAFLIPLSRMIPPLWSAISSSSPRSAYAPLRNSCARDATSGRLYSRPLFLSHLPSSGPPSFCIFSLTPSIFLLIVFVASLLSLPPFSLILFFLPSSPFFLSSFLSPSLLQCGPHARPTLSLARTPRAHHNTHGRSVALAPRSVRSYLLQGTVSRGPQAATARSTGCALSWAAHTTPVRDEPRDRTDRLHFSLPGSACGAFSLPLLPILFSLFLFPSHNILLPYTALSSLLPFLPFSFGEHARDTSRLESCVQPPRCLCQPAATCSFPVLCVFKRCREVRPVKSVNQWDISVHLVHQQVTSGREPVV